LQSIDRIEEITRGKSLNDFANNWQLQYIVERAIEIISEASRAIPRQLTDVRSDIRWDSVRGIGNVLRHEYHSVSAPIVWRVVTDELPALRRAIEDIRSASQRL
jgi:uncharacterized protein with HEPN domain